MIRTAPGMANMLAVTLDACAFSEIVGTVAGDDTIFIALRSEQDRAPVRYVEEQERDPPITCPRSSCRHA